MPFLLSSEFQLDAIVLGIGWGLAILLMLKIKIPTEIFEDNK
jgi:hypothetical protein